VLSAVPLGRYAMNTPAGSDASFRDRERGERLNEAWEEWSLKQAERYRVRSELESDLLYAIEETLDRYLIMSDSWNDEDMRAGVRAFLDAQGLHVVRDWLVTSGKITNAEDWVAGEEEAAREAAAGV
jgi:hypothetical protein